MSLGRSHSAQIGVHADGRIYDRYFPAPDWREETLYEHMRAPVVVASMNEIVCETSWQTSQISQVLLRESNGETRDVLHRIWTFVRTHFKYEVEDGELLREPARAWAERKGDCDCFSIFTASILINLGIPFFFRITKYSSDAEWQHVYVIAKDEDGRQIIVDCCLNLFDAEKPYTQKRDFGGTCGLSGPEEDDQDATGEGTDNDGTWKKIATRYVNVLKDKGREAADNAILEASQGNFNSLVDTGKLTGAARGILGDLMGMGAGMACGAFGVPANLCSAGAKILGDIIEPGLFSIFGWSSEPEKTEETKWAESQSKYISKWLVDNGLVNRSPISSKRDNVRNDFNRLFGSVERNSRKFGLVNGIQLFVVFRCYLETIIDNYEALWKDDIFKKFFHKATPPLTKHDSSDLWPLKLFSQHKTSGDYEFELSTFAFFRLYGAERLPVTLEWNPAYYRDGVEISAAMITAILDPKNVSTFGFSELVLPLAARYPKLEKCLLAQPAALGLLGVWKTIKDSIWDWNRVETLTRQLQANVRSQLDDPDSPLNQEIKKQLDALNKTPDTNTDTKTPDTKTDNTTQNVLVVGAAVGLAFLAFRRIKTPLK